MALTKITKSGLTDSAIDSNKIEADAIDATKIADDAISDEHLDVTAITGHTELASSAATDDILLIYDTSSGTIKKIQSSNVGLQAPVVSSVSPTNALTGDGTGNHTFTITGTGFTVGSTAKLLTSAGADVAFDSVTRNSATQITGVIAKSSLSNANEPYDVVVTTAENVTGRLDNQINIDASPVFVTASGSLGTFTGNDSVNISVNATDPESAGNVTFELQSGTIPPGLSLSNSGADGGTGIISGTATAPASNTTYNFTLRAVDAASNTSSRAFSITVNKLIQYETFNSSGTFSVPEGTTVVDVLVVGGGGGAGHDYGGGGGAGGLIFMPEYPVTPGGTVAVTVGCGGIGGNINPALRNSAGLEGQDSAFGTLTAKGGGGGGGGNTNRSGFTGGSGGGGSGHGTPGQPGGPPAPGGAATQPTQPGNSGAYGFGNNGGFGLRVGPVGLNSGGGGGAGAVGLNGPAVNADCISGGGIGRAYTIADGTTPVYYAGGGAGDVRYQTGTPADYYVQPRAQGGGGASGPIPGNSAGLANRGGGGGATQGTPQGPAGGPGGKGVVIVKY
jgi:hypothetical protein